MTGMHFLTKTLYIEFTMKNDKKIMSELGYKFWECLVFLKVSLVSHCSLAITQTSNVLPSSI